MKKRTLTAMAGYPPAVSAPGSAWQQEPGKPTAHLNNKTQMPVPYNESSYSVPSATHSLINTRARRNFKKCCAMAINEHWVATGNGCMVRFINDHVLNQVNFDRKGNQLRSMKYYGEDKLLPETRDLIKRCYPGLSVTTVTEIKKKNATIYILQLENKTRLTKLRIYNGEWDVMENYSKN
jgi:hypothetical protein